MQAKEYIVNNNTGLVWSIVRKFTNRGTEADDLFQIGSIGLIKAIDKFDTTFGVQFSTYAVPLILGEIKRLFRDGGAVKISRPLKELSLRATRERERLAKVLGREPTVQELADALGVEPTEAAQAISAALPPLSLTRANEEDDAEQIDLPIASPEEQITDRLALQQLLAQLEPRDRRIIELRYIARRTQQATAEQLGMTQVQVSRRERTLLLTMREKLTI